jgi:predicted amidohydrolase
VPRSIAVAQTCPIAGDVHANAAEHLRLIAVAASLGALLVLFPELSLTGYEIDLAGGLAFEEEDPRLDALRGAAAAHSLTVIAGAPVRIGRALHIGAFILSPDGTGALYTKHRLGAFGESARRDGTVPPAEATVFQAGDRDPLVHFGGGHVAAVAICADIGRPSHPQHAADRGAATYLASMFVIPSDFEGDAAKLRAYAAQHAMVVALANFGSATGGLGAAGRSAIWSQTGEPVVQLKASGSGVAVATETSAGWSGETVMLRETAWSG